MSKQNKPTKQNACCFCGLSEDHELEFGKFCELDDIRTHYFCLLLSSNMQQRGRDDQGILGFLLIDIKKEIRRGKKLTCTYCKKTGATLGCCNVKCKRMFHYPCGLRAGTLNQFFGEFRSYCINHRPKQRIDGQAKIESAKSHETICYICYEKVDPYDIVETIWAPCCKKNAWFHRKCVQQLATSAGYFFKCPLCNDKKKFQKAMLEFGIFIPSQDASWELEPNAFQELLYRHDQCDAQICLCPKGRKFTNINPKWELALCRTCGSQGIHMACGGLKWANPLWECSECMSILGKSVQSASSSRTQDTVKIDSDSDDTDSDISVGKDSPVPFISCSPTVSSIPQELIAKLRPGPRTFKLQQLKANSEMQECIKKQNVKNTNSSTHCTTEEYSPQSTSNGEICTRARLNVDRNSSNLKHSKSQLRKSLHNVITVDSDDDVIEVDNCNLLDDTLICANKDEIGSDDLFQPKSENTDELKDVVASHSFSPLQIERLFYENNLNQRNSNHNTQKEMKSNDLDDTILINKSVYTCTDSISNIKITNVISLAPEEFGYTQFVEGERNITENKILDDISTSNLKRKLDETPSSQIVSCADISKRVKKGDKQLEETMNISNISLHNYTHFLADTNDINVVDNECHSSVTVLNLENQGPSMQVKGNCDRDIKHTCSTRNALEMPESSKVNGNRKNCDGGAGTSPAVESRNRSITDDTRNNSGQEFVKSSDSSKERVQLSGPWKSEDNVDTPIPKRRSPSIKSNNGYDEKQDGNTDCNYPRLIPEYIRLRDLKFRIHNVNNLQMILYDKFSVSIDMERPNTMIRSTRLDISTKKTAQQNICKTQTETPANFRSGNVLQSISSVCNKDKCKYMLASEQLEDYEDGKENLDPVATIPCKTTTDNILTNTTLVTNDSSVSTNGNNQKENESSTQPAPNAIQNDDKERSNKNIGLINVIESTFEASTSCKNKYTKSNNYANENIPKLKYDRATNGALKMQSPNIGLKNGPQGSIKLVRRALFSANRANCESENNIETMDKTKLRVSIDLKKIENFIDDNPNLFPQDKKEDNEWCAEEAVFLRERNSLGEETNISGRITNAAGNGVECLEPITLIHRIKSEGT